MYMRAAGDEIPQYRGVDAIAENKKILNDLISYVENTRRIDRTKVLKILKLLKENNKPKSDSLLYKA